MADPQKGAPVEITCPAPIGTVDAVVFGNGQYTPALDTNSTAVLIPVGFKDVFVRVTAGDGTVIFEAEEPDVEKNGQRRGIDLVECTFAQEFQEDTPDGPITITVTGTVIGFSAKG